MAESRKVTFPELGRTGLSQSSGYIREEFLRELQGLRWPKNVREMTKNDPIIGAAFFVFDKMGRQVTWKIEAGSQDNADLEIAEFIRGCLFDDMSSPWRETVSEFHSYLPWGWALLEECYKRRSGESRDPDESSRFNDGRIGWSKWPIRAQESLLRWEMDENGRTMGMWQRAAPDYRTVLIPMEKALLFRSSTHKGNPEGESLCRSIFRPWYLKKHIENLEAIGVERDLAGLPVIYAPADILNAEDGSDEASSRDGLRTIITSIKNNEQAGALLPSDVYGGTNIPMYKLELLSSAGAKAFDTSKIIERYDRRILTTLLADFLMMGHEKVGSFALASRKTEMFSYALGAFLDSDCEIVNRHAIPRLLRLNGMPTVNPPKLTHGDLESIELLDVANFISTLSGANFRLTPDQLQYLLTQAGLPVSDDPAEVEKAMMPKEPQQADKPQDPNQEDDGQDL